MHPRFYSLAGSALLAATLLGAGCKSPSSSEPASALETAPNSAAADATGPRVREDFDFDWHFHLGDITNSGEPPFDVAGWRSLNVPHDYSVEGNFSQTNFSCTGYLPGGIAWYQKSFVIPADWEDKLVSVQFDGVSENSQVWLNGNLVGGHPWAYTTFTVDLTG